VQGSGLSEGSYVTLGAFEVDDLAAVVQYLRDEGTPVHADSTQRCKASDGSWGKLESRERLRSGVAANWPP
jgi:alpha/beta superfamily hydrolase